MDLDWESKATSNDSNNLKLESSRQIVTSDLNSLTDMDSYPSIIDLLQIDDEVDDRVGMTLTMTNELVHEQFSHAALTAL